MKYKDRTMNDEKFKEIVFDRLDTDRETTILVIKGWVEAMDYHLEMVDDKIPYYKAINLLYKFADKYNDYCVVQPKETKIPELIDILGEYWYYGDELLKSYHLAKKMEPFLTIRCIIAVLMRLFGPVIICAFISYLFPWSLLSFVAVIISIIYYLSCVFNRITYGTWI